MATNKDDHLRILQNVYTVILGLGLKDLVDAVLTPAKSIVTNFRNAAGTDSLAILWGASILALGVRFFFIIEQISQYIIDCRTAVPPKNFSVRWLVVFHYPFIILQACLFYAVCELIKGAVASDDPLIGFTSAARLQAFLLLLNSAWLGRLVWARKMKRLNLKYEQKWQVNNTVFAIATLIATGLSRGLPAPSLARMSVIVGLFFANSIIDFTMTSDAYVPQT